MYTINRNDFGLNASTLEELITALQTKSVDKWPVKLSATPVEVGGGGGGGAAAPAKPKEEEAPKVAVAEEPTAPPAEADTKGAEDAEAKAKADKEAAAASKAKADTDAKAKADKEAAAASKAKADADAKAKADQACDTNGDNLITKQEFAKAHSNQTMDEQSAAFAKRDQDRDGLLPLSQKTELATATNGDAAAAAAAATAEAKKTAAAKKSRLKKMGSTMRAMGGIEQELADLVAEEEAKDAAVPVQLLANESAEIASGITSAQSALKALQEQQEETKRQMESRRQMAMQLQVRARRFCAPPGCARHALARDGPPAAAAPRLALSGHASSYRTRATRPSRTWPPFSLPSRALCFSLPLSLSLSFSFSLSLYLCISASLHLCNCRHLSV